MFPLRLVSITGAAVALIALTSCGNSTSTNTASAPNSNGSPASPEETTSETASATDDQEDVAYMTTLGLMKGHMLVAKELLDAGKPEQAEPHVGHPVDELYGEVKGQLPERNVEEFDTTLNELHELVKSNPKAPEVASQYKASMQAIDQAIAALPADKRQSPEFVLGVINGLLNTANEEYGAAIADGKIVEIIEYQDSRGFVMYAETLYQDISEQVSQENPEADQAIVSNLTELKKVWPSVTSPDTPVMTPEQVSELVETVKENTQKVSV